MVRKAAILLLFTFAFSASGQERTAGGMSFGYKFEGARFYISLIEIDTTADGSSEIRFKRGESDDVITLKLKLLPSTLARIRHLFDISRFLASDEEYQNKRDFSHLGWITIWARQGEQYRKARFNHTTNEAVKELAEIFRGIHTQQMHLFDIETTGQYQPLDLPRQLESLENDLRLERVTEPEQMVAALREIAGSDTLPLIARNHAKRIIEGIEKKKFKSPVKNSRQ